MEIIKILQNDVAPNIFTPRVAYDGRKNIFSAHALKLTGPDGLSQTFSVPVAQANGGPNPTRAPKVYNVKLTHASTINPELLERFIRGQQSHDNEAITAITACNIALRMEPNLNFPFNVRSFFIEQLDKRDIGYGIELWRGLFQSLRPGISRMFVNVDIATGMMYKRGSLLDLCLEVLERGNDPNFLAPSLGLPDNQRIRVQRFIAGVNVIVQTTGGRKRVVRSLTKQSADQITFDHNGRTITVAQYFQAQLGRPLRFPKLICAEVGKNAIVPLEVCTVVPGQIIRKQIPPHKTTDVLNFATKKPQERFEIIRRGTQYLQYGQSEYIRSFGMSVTTAGGPLEVPARKLNPPRLNYGRGSKDATIVPRDGSWNMAGTRVFKPCAPIKQWVMVVYESERRFNQEACRNVIQGLVGEAKKMGMTFEHANPVVKYKSPGPHVSKQLDEVGREVFQQTKIPPTLVVVILPEGGDEIYTSVKHFGDIVRGVATQCLIGRKCSRARPQYWANVLLKVNVKLGGINSIIDPSGSPLADPANPTVVMGADVIHPAPGSEGRPSFTALVSSVDTHATKYIACNNVQEGRTEIIEDLEAMVENGLTNYIDYRREVERAGPNMLKPKRLIFFRDGVSEGEFAKVLQNELPLIKAALAKKGLDKYTKVTLVVVGKRHHIRFNPLTDADRSGNAPAGTVVDREIAHPTEFDYYLLSQGGLLGTSRPSHYSVLYDENGFNSDAMQGISYALCHVYARATRSVSIPAPVYYADIVCARAKTHYDPQGRHLLADTATQTSGGAASMLESFKQNFMPLSRYAQRNMYFS
ncbi:eukaryotic translation initiation factor 2C [Coprinopsis cinerea AmutBmut pab1-1]|nr:eukaryotic translation initiation factor 2C [Coprinopsis cinerea AmutBmut pab1-1]